MRPWTEEDTQELRDLIKDGLSWTQIARKIGRSRNSVAGKITRMNGTKTVRTLEAGRAGRSCRTESGRCGTDHRGRNVKPKEYRTTRDLIIPAGTRVIHLDGRLVFGRFDGDVGFSMGLDSSLERGVIECAESVTDYAPKTES